jgi:hypothetical protein
MQEITTIGLDIAKSAIASKAIFIRAHGPPRKVTSLAANRDKTKSW